MSTSSGAERFEGLALAVARAAEKVMISENFMLEDGIIKETIEDIDILLES